MPLACSLDTTTNGISVGVCCRKVFWEFWSGRRDLNSGPLAPQATNINHLQTPLYENKRLEAMRFGRQMDARTRCRGVLDSGWTPEAAPRTSEAHEEIAMLPVREMRATNGPGREFRISQISGMTIRNTAAISLPRRLPEGPQCLLRSF